jgi:hypothetical protein
MLIQQFPSEMGHKAESNFHFMTIFHTNDQWKSNFHSNHHIFIVWGYFTQMTNKSQIFTQITIFSGIEDTSHKWPIQVKFSLKWPYFHTLMIFHTNDQRKSEFHSNGHIFTHRTYFIEMTNESQIFTKTSIFYTNDPGLSLINTSLCSLKYSGTIDICCNMWKWAWWNKFKSGVWSLCLLASPHMMRHQNTNRVTRVIVI